VEWPNQRNPIFIRYPLLSNFPEIKPILFKVNPKEAIGYQNRPVR
jgi:hypothetical protein